jgi:hypothetical protein
MSFDFSVINTGSGVVTVQLDGSSPSGGAVQKSIAMSALVVCCSAWPEQAVKQSELDQIACDICHHAGGEGNMAICSVCDHCIDLDRSQHSNGST